MLRQIIVQTKKKKSRKLWVKLKVRLRLSLDLCTELVTFYPETARA